MAYCSMCCSREFFWGLPGKGESESSLSHSSPFCFFNTRLQEMLRALKEETAHAASLNKYSVKQWQNMKHNDLRCVRVAFGGMVGWMGGSDEKA